MRLRDYVYMWQLYLSSHRHPVQQTRHFIHSFLKYIGNSFSYH